MAQKFDKIEGYLDYGIGNKVLELSNNYHETALILELELNVTNSSAVYTDPNNLFSIISNFNITGDANNNIKQIYGEKLVYNNIIDFGKIGKTVVSTANGTVTQKQTAILNFNTIGTIRPYDTIFNTRAFRNLILEVTFLGASALGSGITINSGKLKVSSKQLLDYNRNAGERVIYYKEVVNKRVQVTNGNGFFIELPTERRYKSILLKVEKGGSRADNIVKHIRLKSGNTDFISQDAPTLKNAFILNNGIINDSDMTGLYPINFIERGHITDALNTVTKESDYNTLEFLLDIDGADATTFVTVYSDFFEVTNLVETPVKTTKTV
jgi:hypothetical protein